MIFSNIVGTFLENKGIHIYVEAVKDIDCAKCKFELVGEWGPDIKYNNYIKQILHNKILLRGFINNIKNYYSKVDVVVLTSIKPDSLPTVLIEGLAKGKILIATDVGGVREIVEEKYGNIIIPPTDIKALKKAIEKVSRYSNDKIEEIKIHNINMAKNKFRLKRQIKEIESIYYELYKTI